MNREDFQKLVAAQNDYLIRQRRYFHMYPELSGCEENTIRHICEELDSFDIPYEVVPEGGIIGVIDSGRPGKCMMLRADIDALPVQEDPRNLVQDRVVVSQNRGVSHVCGHDGHTAILLTVSKILSQNKNLFTGKILIMFERGEEGTGNYKYLHKYLQEKQIPIHYTWGLHLISSIPSGKIAILPRTVLAGIIEFKAEIHGAGGHGSRPDDAKNPIPCFNAIMNSVETIRMNRISPFDPLTFSVCHVNAGTVNNVIPSELVFEGTIRFMDLNSGVRFAEEFGKIAQLLCDAHGCTIRWSTTEPRIPVINDPYCREKAYEAVSRYAGEEKLFECNPLMVSDTMAYTLNKWPGVYALVGLENKEFGSGAEHHNSKFDIDEATLPVGVAATLSYVLHLMD